MKELLVNASGCTRRWILFFWQQTDSIDVRRLLQKEKATESPSSNSWVNAFDPTESRQGNEQTGTFKPTNDNADCGFATHS